MKTVYQLQKAGKRLPRLKRKAEQILAKGRRGGEELSDREVGFYNMRIFGCEQALGLMQYELANRRIGLPPFRDATPHRLRRSV